MTKPRCPKCKCKRWRCVGELACYPGPNPSPKRRVVIKRVIECMRCDFVYTRRT